MTLAERCEYHGERADRALATLQQWFCSDRIDLATFEALAEDLLAGRPTELPFYVPRLLTGTEWR